MTLETGDRIISYKKILNSHYQDDLDLDLDLLNCIYEESEDIFCHQDDSMNSNAELNQKSASTSIQNVKQEYFRLDQQQPPLRSFESVENSNDQLSIKHFKNKRIKKYQKKKLYKLYKMVSKQPHLQEKVTLSKYTKNLLTFAKKPIFDYIICKKGHSFIDKHGWIKEIQEKNSISLTDYNKLYNCKQLEQTFQIFFNKQILFRYLMTSKLNYENRMFYLYHMNIFKRNFEKREFKSISEPMREHQKQKKNTFRLQ